MPKSQTKKISATSAFENFFKEAVIDPVLSHPRSSYEVKFGFPPNVIASEVIRKGLADFSSSFVHPDYGTLIAYQRCQLYAFFAMKGHFFEAKKHYLLAKAHFENLLDSTLHTVLIDFGCGPATAALAFGEVFHDFAFTYYGIDRADDMRRIAASFVLQAKNGGLLNHEVNAKWFSHWKEVELPEEKFNVILNFCYFFASPTLTEPEIASLVEFVELLLDSKLVVSVLMSYINTDRDIGNEHYKTFTDLLAKRGVMSSPESCNFSYCKSDSTNEKHVTFRREVIELK